MPSRNDSEWRVAIDGWFFLPKRYFYPFKALKDIYEKRKEIKDSDPVLAHTYKLIMNSLYGKFAEKKNKVVVKKSPFPDARELSIDGMKYYVGSVLKPGKVFNPVYASYITSLTRCMLLETALKSPDSILSFATDSVLTTKPFIEESDNLGGWKLEFEGEAVLIMSGVYSLRNDTTVKTRFRGFPLKEEYNFFDLLEKHANDSSLRIEFQKALKLGEIIKNHNLYEVEQLNHFIQMSKELNPLNERKRAWLSYPIKLSDLLENEYDSVPHNIAQTDMWYSGDIPCHYKAYAWNNIKHREVNELLWHTERLNLLY